MPPAPIHECYNARPADKGKLETTCPNRLLGYPLFSVSRFSKDHARIQEGLTTFLPNSYQGTLGKDISPPYPPSTTRFEVVTPLETPMTKSASDHTSSHHRRGLSITLGLRTSSPNILGSCEKGITSKTTTRTRAKLGDESIVSALIHSWSFRN